MVYDTCRECFSHVSKMFLTRAINVSHTCRKLRISFRCNKEGPEPQLRPICTKKLSKLYGYPVSVYLCPPNEWPPPPPVLLIDEEPPPPKLRLLEPPPKLLLDPPKLLLGAL